MEKIKRLSEIIGFKIPLDGLLMAAFGMPVMDILKFDEKIRKMYPVDWECKSLNEIILEKYGQEAFNLFNEII